MRNVLSRWKKILIISLLIRLSLFIFPLFLSLGLSVDYISPWVRWDGDHYIEIAKNGYVTSGEQALFIVFYPLYPLLIKLIALVLGNFQLSAILISLIFSLVASVLLYEVALLDFDVKVGEKSVVLLNLFPTSYFLQASYTESLFLSLTLLSYFLFRTRKTLISGIFGTLSSLTRVNGLLLIPFIFFEKGRIKEKIALSTLTIIGFLIYLFINFINFHDAFYFTRPLYSNWYKHFEWPWISFIQGINGIRSINNTTDFVYMFEYVFIVFTLILGVLTFLKLKKSYGVYILLNLILATSTSFILSIPRYVLVLFPIYILLAKFSNRYLFISLLLVFIPLLLFFSSLYLRGQWAF